MNTTGKIILDNLSILLTLFNPRASVNTLLCRTFRVPKKHDQHRNKIDSLALKRLASVGFLRPFSFDDSSDNDTLI